MKWNMSVGTRILGGYTLVLLIVGGIGSFAYRATADLIESANQVTQAHKVKESLTQLLSELKDGETGLRGFIITGQEPYLIPYTSGVSEFDNTIRSLRRLLEGQGEQQRLLEQLEATGRAKLTEMAKTLAFRRDRGEAAAAQEMLTDRGREQMTEFRRLSAEMDAVANEKLREQDQRSRATAAFARTAMVVGGLLVVVFVFGVGMATRHSITSPLNTFMRFANRVGEGDLTQGANITSQDELGELSVCLDKMVGGLKDVAGQTRSATQNLNAAAAEILASTQQQAAGTSEQAAAIQQTTSTMEEVTQSGLQIAERAKQVAAFAESTSTTSRAGLEAVESTNRTMEAIREQAEAVAENVVSLSEKTQAIGQIISTVNDLAEQSHLLALNAAIEAAAAGEHGRTFTIIAGEVKNLADQSREATIQVRSILGEIQKGINTSVMLSEEAVKRVDSGKRQADVADQTIRGMTDGIQQSVQAFQQILAGSSQQQIGFGQVTQAIRDIGQASQQSAASTQQLEKAALGLTSLAQQLQRAIERYRI